MLGGAENIIDVIKNLKALAIEAATDTNTDEDRAILQKNLDQALENINDIATTTHYNGKYLLDGSLATVIQGTSTDLQTQTTTVYKTVETTVTVETTTTIETTTTVTDFVEVPTTTTVSTTTTIETTTTVESTVTTTETSTTPIEISGNSITADGVYQLASDFTGTLNISAQNVKIVGNGTLNNATINVTASNANLWIQDLN